MLVSTEVLGTNWWPEAGGTGVAADGAGASGISEMQMYPPRRAIYSQSATAKYASITARTPAITKRDVANWARLSGSDTAVHATLNATKCARPVQMLTANVEPARSREKTTDVESAANASSPLRTENIVASDSSQLSADHATQIKAARGKKRAKAKPGRGVAAGDAKLTRIAAPTSANDAASTRARRRKFRARSARNGRN